MTDPSTTSDGAVVVAVGAHIGDMDLAAGPALAQNVLDGGTSVLVALTPGERGHPRMSAADYRQQKITEGARLAEAIGAQFEVFDDLSDGFLADDEPTAQRLARLLRRYRPDTLLAHWRHSIHSDHRHASALAERARFLAGLPGWEVDDKDDAPPERRRHGIGRLLFTENWEDAESFTPQVHVSISEEAYRRWHAGISTQAFARGETYGFRYIDYYAAQLIMRGCLARTDRAVAFGLEAGSPMTRLMPRR
ncbi:PIG-L deacetylase family protein [Propionibacteriaceae bacterium Y1685]